MGTSQFTPDEILSIVGHTYRSIDVRVAAVRDGDVWWNSLAILRCSCLPPEAARERGTESPYHIRRLETSSFRIETSIRAFSELSDIRAAAEEGLLEIAGVKVRLRQNLEWNSLRPGYLTFGGQATTAVGGERWPGVEIVHGQSLPQFLNDPVRHREVSVHGYESPYEAIAAICDASVWPSGSQNNELYLWFPVFAALTDAVLSPEERRLAVRISRRGQVEDLFLNATVTPYGGNGPTHRFHQPIRPESPLEATNSTGIQTIESSLLLPAGQLSDRIEMRLSHQQLGEINRLSRYASELLPRAQVNPLLEALKSFCSESEFTELLVHPWSAQKEGRRSKTKAGQDNMAFEEHVAWLLSGLGFSAIRLGSHERLRAPGTDFQRGSVDILASKAGQDILLVIGCTMGTPSPQDYTNILSACAALRQEVFGHTSVKLSPIVVTAALDSPAFFSGSTESVVILDGDRLRQVVELAISGQEEQAAAYFMIPRTRA